MSGIRGPISQRTGMLQSWILTISLVLCGTLVNNQARDSTVTIANTMTIYLIRHAQSEFNAVYDADKPDPMIFDAPLSKLGEHQAVQAKTMLPELDISRLIVSPLTRTLQTAALMFGGALPVEINSTVREQVLNSCDIGRHPAALTNDFPEHDFAHLAERWWHDEEKDHRGISVEPHEILLQRTADFVEYLKFQQKVERTHSTAVVSHGNFIQALTGIQPNNCEIIKFDLASGTATPIEYSIDARLPANT